MVVTCEEVRREISNYLDGEAGPELRAAMEEHLLGCSPCRSVLAGTRNVITLYGEELMFEPPLGFSQRLHQRLEQNMPRKRGPAFGWMVALAAAALVVIGFQVGNSSTFVDPQLRSRLAQSGSGIPANLMVLVTEDGKTFHVAGCTFIHDKTKLRSITAHEAQLEGYAPCVRCMRKYLTASTRSGVDTNGGEFAALPETAE
jgi:Putative zinc-finger